MFAIDEQPPMANYCFEFEEGKTQILEKVWSSICQETVEKQRDAIREFLTKAVVTFPS